MSYSPQPKETSLWSTLSKHASNMFEHGKKLAGQAAKRVADATTPEPNTPTMMSTSVGVARTPAPMPVSTPMARPATMSRPATMARPATMTRPATMARPATIAGGKKKGKKGKGKTAKRGKKGTKAKAKKGTRAKKGTKRK